MITLTKDIKLSPPTLSILRVLLMNAGEKLTYQDIISEINPEYLEDYLWYIDGRLGNLIDLGLAKRTIHRVGTSNPNSFEINEMSVVPYFMLADCDTYSYRYCGTDAVLVLKTFFKLDSVHKMNRTIANLISETGLKGLVIQKCVQQLKTIGLLEERYDKLLGQITYNLKL